MKAYIYDRDACQANMARVIIVDLEQAGDLGLTRGELLAELAAFGARLCGDGFTAADMDIRLQE